MPDWPFGDLPRQHFACVLIDPPWEWTGGKAGRPQHYPRMKDREIAALPIKDLCDPAGAWVFLWVTSSGLARALKVAAAWKLRYSGRAFVWIKTQRCDGDATPMWVYPSKTHMGMGFTTRKNAEDVLLFRVGKPQRLSKSVREIIFTGPREHSRKPTEAFARIEEFCPGPRLELFAREPRPGWAAWGTETQKFAPAPMESVA